MGRPRLMSARKIGCLFACFLLSLGCGSESPPGIEVVDFWAMGGEGERIQPLIAEFEKAHPGVRIRLQQVPWTAAHEKLLTGFAGDALPDVCQLGNTWIAEFAALGALTDLTDRVAESQAVDRDDFFEGIWQSNVVDGRTYGVPWYVDTRLLFYRTDMLAAAGHASPPKSWAEWMAVMRDVQQTQPPGKYAALLPINEFEQPVILGMQAGAEMLADDGRRGAFGDERFRRAFEFYVNIFREGLAPKESNTRISNVWLEFERGTFAIYISGPWNVQEFRRRMPPAMQDKWTTAPWPSIDGEGVGVSNAGGSSLVLFDHAAGNDAAWHFIEFLSRAEQQARCFELTSSLPANRRAWQSTGLAEDAQFAAFHEQLANVRPVPRVPEWEQIVTGELVRTAESVITGKATIDEALDSLDARVDEILEKRRWMLARQR
jgi:multiple sugar transport system substrate-binding protein